jgi:hypothetical protein
MGRIVFAAMVIGGLVLSSVSFGYPGGSGTAEDPYQIADANDLLALAADTSNYDKCFILTADIDLDPNLPGGQVFTTAIIAVDTSPDWDFQGTAFTGTFDGNSHKITNFTINGGSNYYLGLFGYIYPGGKVKNLGLEDFAVSGSSDSQYVGGLVGYSYGNISNCNSTGSVSGSSCVGGLVGLNYGTISNCDSTGTVTGIYGLGGLVGWNYGNISNCFSTGAVTGGDHSEYLGGLVGYNYGGDVNNCYSTGVVSGSSDSQDVGGLVGGNGEGSISDCYSTGMVIGTSDVGGLVGSNYYGSISNCYSTGAVSGSDYVGGLVGYNYGSISSCYSTGTVSGSNSVGGLVGWNYGDGSISNCYSTGAVSGSWGVGGLVGYNEGGSISNCYSTGDVSGGDNSYYLGGLVGLNYGTISYCYSTGAVTAGGGSYDLGGLVGYNDGSISGCYFLIDSGPVNGYGTPLTDEEMKQQSSFVGWDFTTIWAICEGTNYPRLLWQIPAADFVCPDGVDFIDFAIFANAWLSDPMQANWNSRCDIAEPPDSVIDILDLAIFAQHWLEM